MKVRGDILRPQHSTAKRALVGKVNRKALIGNYYNPKQVGNPQKRTPFSPRSHLRLSKEKDITKRHNQRHHQRQPGEQQFPILVVTDKSNI